MNKVERIILALAFVLSISGAFLAFNKEAPVNLGSVDNGGVYVSQNITTTNASTTAAIPIKGGASVLGSVVVLKTSAVALGIYDGTSTTTGATLIGTLPASIAAGTYTFDVATLRGIVLSSNVGFTGDYVITYR